MKSDRAERRESDVVEFLPALLANFLPIVGIALLDWRAVEILLIYWLELLVALLAYGVAALFAKRRIVLEGRSLFLPGVSRTAELDGPRWTTPPDGIRPADSLPPVYPRNLRVVCMSLVWGLGFLVLPLLIFDVAIRAAVSLAVVGTALAIVGSTLGEVRREVFDDRSYEELSAHMVLEIPCRVIFFMFVLLALLQAVGTFLLLAAVFVFGLPVSDAAVEIVYATVLILGKIVVEWSRFRANREPDPDGVANWFVPEDPLA